MKKKKKTISPTGAENITLLYACFRFTVIRSAGVCHAGRLRPRGNGLEEALFLTGMKNTCNISNVQFKGSRCESFFTVCLLYSIMHELTGVHFVLAGVKLGTTGGD